MVRLPANAIRELSKIDKVSQEFYQTLERSPTEQELCEILMISKEMIKDLRQKDQKSFPLSKPILEDDKDSGTHEDQLIEKDKVDITNNISLRETLEKIFNTLDAREVNIMKYYFGIDEFSYHSHEETANRFGYK